MMASMAQPYSPHPAGLQHPGVAQGHPMAGVHPQQGGPGMPQQMHMGVSAPGVPQVTQAGAMMAGMPPGVVGPGGPSAHALSHLNPNQAQMYQQQQQMVCKYKSLGCVCPGKPCFRIGRREYYLMENRLT
jgi:hypothetical protein